MFSLVHGNAFPPIVAAASVQLARRLSAGLFLLRSRQRPGADGHPTGQCVMLLWPTCPG
jgi:hypothetical protein